MFKFDHITYLTIKLAMVLFDLENYLLSMLIMTQIPHCKVTITNTK